MQADALEDLRLHAPLGVPARSTLRESESESGPLLFGYFRLAAQGKVTSRGSATRISFDHAPRKNQIPSIRVHGLTVPSRRCCPATDIEVAGHLQHQALIWLSPPLWGTSTRFPYYLRRIYNRLYGPDSAIHRTSCHKNPNTRVPMPTVFWDSDLRCSEIARRRLRTATRRTYRLSTYASTISPLNYQRHVRWLP